MTGHTRIGTRLATGLLAMAIAVVPFQAAFSAHHGRRGKQADRRPRLAPGRGRDLQQPGPRRLVGRAAVRRRPVARRVPRRCQGPECRPGRVRRARVAESKRVVVHDGVGWQLHWLQPQWRARQGSRRADRLDLHGLATGQLGTCTFAGSFDVLSPDRGQCDSEKGAASADRRLHRGQCALGRCDRPEGARGRRRPRLEHPTSSRTADGVVLEGKVLDLATGRPDRRCGWPGTSSSRGKALRNQYVGVWASADPQAHWVLKKAPARADNGSSSRRTASCRASPAMPGSTSNRALGLLRFPDCRVPPPSRDGSSTNRASRWRTSRCGFRPHRRSGARWPL